MENKKIFLIISVIAVVLLGGAYFVSQNSKSQEELETIKTYEDMMKLKEQQKAEMCESAKAPDPAVMVEEDMYPEVVMNIKDYGTMTFELYPNEAPQSVYNFIELAESGYYDGLVMHRLVPGFVVQGGDPKGDGTGGPGYGVEGEFCSNGIKNTLPHKKGGLAMARSGEPNSAGSQFYINFADQPSLDGDYAVFGQMTSGEGVLQELEKAAVNGESPTNPIEIESIEIDTKGIDYPSPNKL